MTREVGRWGGVRAAGVGVLVAGAAAALAACGSSGSDADVVAGKQLFVSKCGACHTLGRAGTKGTVGPNLDQAFQQAVKDGMGRDGIEGAVKEQIAHPRAHSQMPAGLVKGDQAVDVAQYIALSTARGGQDTGRLAEAVKKAGGGAPAVAKGGTLEIDTDKTGQLAYVTDRATAPAGQAHGREPEPGLHPARHRHRREGQRRRGDGRRRVEVHRDLREGHLHLLLLGPGPPPGRHGGQAHRQVGTSRRRRPAVASGAPDPARVPT